MTDCKNCLHVAVCARYSATGGMVKKCQHFATGTNVGSKWIPVAERLPEVNGRYLCNVKSSAFRGSFYQAILYCDKYGFREGHIYTDDVTHWMPLPEAPKQGKPSCERCTNDGLDIPHCKECPASGFLWFREKV